MSKTYQTVIVGGGYSALVLACSLNNNDSTNKVAILEKLERVGKKILSTGNGRGNICNKWLDEDKFHGENPAFCSYAINRYNGSSVMSFFGNLGLLFASDDDRIYPASMQANSVLDALRFEILKKKIDVYTSCEIKKIEYDSDTKKYKLSNDNGSVFANNVVLAFGGASQKQFGTDGKSFVLARQLGHRITELSPSLVQLKTSEAFVKTLKGIKSEVKLSLFEGEKFIKSSLGDVLFTDSGISGNTAFYLSSYLSGLKMPRVSIEFIPEITENRLIDHLLFKKQQFGELDSSEFLNGIIHKQIGKLIVKKCTNASRINEISLREITHICKEIKSFSIKISGTLGFDYSQVTHGGIDTAEIDDKTFESKIAKNVYVIGEALDIDGDCGGYNLQWAYSSARCVAEALNGKNIKH